MAGSLKKQDHECIRWHMLEPLKNLEEIKALLFGDRKSSPILIVIYLTYVCERINGTVYSDNIGQH